MDGRDTSAANASDLAPAISPTQMRALFAPARQEIVDVLAAAGPCSVARLGELLGRPADALYHHLRQLARVGLVVETERRKQGRHAFVVYDLGVRSLRLSYSAAARRSDIARVVAGAQRLTWREYKRALLAGEGATKGPQRTLWGGRAKGWATPEQLARVNELLAELIEILRAGGPTDSATPVSLSFVLAPSPANRRTAAPPVAERSRAQARPARRVRQSSAATSASGAPSRHKKQRKEGS